MTLGDISTHASFLTGKDTTAFPNADRLISINKWFHKIVTMIFATQDEWDWDDDNRSDFPIMTTAMVAAQRDYEIPVSEDALRIKRVDITYNGSKYYRAEPLDIASYGKGLGNDTDIDADFNKTSPFYDIQGNSLFIYPLPDGADVTAGAEIRLMIARDGVDFTSGELTTGTIIPGFDEPFHDMISLGMAHDWFLAHGPSERLTELKAELQEAELRLKQHYGSKQADRVLVAKSAYINYE